MTKNEFLAEYQKHPIILRMVPSSTDGRHVDVLLTADDSYLGGCGFSTHNGIAVWVHSFTIGDTKINLSVTQTALPLLPSTNGVSGFLHYNGGGDYSIKNMEKSRPAIATLPAEYLVDGATLPVGYSDFLDLYLAFQEFPHIVIATELDGKSICIPSLYTSVDMETYTTTVKCFSPTSGEIITIILVLNV